MLTLLLLFMTTPDVIIHGDQAATFFQPKAITAAGSGFYALAKDNRLFHIDQSGIITQEFGGKGQGPGELSIGVDLLWVEETQELWVADPGKQQLHLYRAGAYLRSISIKSVASLFQQDGHIVVAPSLAEDAFVVFSPDGAEVRRFTSTFVFPEDHYQDVSIWRSFQAIPLRDGRILMGYIWANKLSVINSDGSHFRAWDMADYYNEYRLEQFPKYFSQLGAVETDGGNIWVLTCDHESKSCRELLLLDYQAKTIVGRALSDVGLRTISKLQDGRYVVIEAETDTAKVFKDFPYAVKRKSP